MEAVLQWERGSWAGGTQSRSTWLETGGRAVLRSPHGVMEGTATTELVKSYFPALGDLGCLLSSPSSGKRRESLPSQC